MFVFHKGIWSQESRGRIVLLLSSTENSVKLTEFFSSALYSNKEIVKSLTQNHVNLT